MKVAMVGTTATLTENQQTNMEKKIISILLKPYPPDTVIISGGAKGVDALAIEIAKDMGFQTQTEQYKPEKEEWKYYKKRNLQLANDCDELHCFSISVYKKKCYHHKPPQKHEKTAGCWTRNKVIQMNKPTKLHVVS